MSAIAREMSDHRRRLRNAMVGEQPIRPRSGPTIGRSPKRYAPAMPLERIASRLTSRARISSGSKRRCDAASLAVMAM